MIRRWFLVVLVLAAPSVVVVACFDSADDCTQTETCPPCQHPDMSHVDENGVLDPCHCDDDAGTVGWRVSDYCSRFLSWSSGDDAGGG